MVVMRKEKIVFIFVPIDVNTNVVFGVQIYQCLLCLRGIGFQKCLTCVLIYGFFCAVLDVTTLGWTPENISRHYFEY